MKEWLRIIRDPSADPYERRFRVFSPIGLITVALWIIVITVLDYDPVRLVFFSVSLTLYSLTIVLSVRTGRIQTGAILCTCGMEFALMPYVFFREGGVYGGAFNYSVCALIFILMSVKGRMRTVLIITDLLAVNACFAVSYFRPEWTAEPERKIMFVNAYTEMIIPFIMAMASLLFQMYMFRQESSALAKQRDETAELNRAQNRFFSSMSHEIRTPINTIIGLNEMNMREKDISDEVYVNNRNIQGASNMLLTLINDILDMSKIESGKMDIVPVTYETATMLTEIINMISGRAEAKGLKFDVEVDPALPMQLFGDEVRIKQVLINLLNNAVKYTPAGSVKLSVQCDYTDEKNVRITYRVEDTGMGIKKEAMPDLFDAFKRVDQEANRNIEGTGLGLSIVKQIVDLMGGEISVDSIYTKGSVFSVSLVQEVAGEEKIGTLSLKSSGIAKERDVYLQSFEAPGASVLIVDDNELNLQVESKLLSATKMRTDLASSGKECLSMTFRERYDVILMDHLMPGMDGIETLKEIRSQRGGLNRRTPIVALTANAGSENQALYAREGFDGYLVKPVTGEQLENALMQLLPKEKVTLTGTATMQGGREIIAGQHAKKRRIAVSCESGADLPGWMLRKYHISVIHSLIRTEESVFHDGVDIESDALLEYMDRQGKDARSEPPSVASYESFFAEELTRAQSIVHISIANGIAKEYENAKTAAQSFDRVHVEDSESFSAGTGLLVLYAAHLAEREDNTEQFLKQIRIIKNRIRSSFIVDSTKLLMRGGRISASVHRLMRALILHPVLRMKRGRFVVDRVFVGNRSVYRRRYIRNALRRSAAIDPSILIVIYAAMTEEELTLVRSIIDAEMKFRSVLFVKTSGAIAVNSGRGSFALMFLERDENHETDGAFDFLEPDSDDETAVRESLKPDEKESESEEGEREEEVSVPVYGTTPLQKLYGASTALDYGESMKYLAGEELMEKTLRAFYESIADNADDIERLLAEEDYDNFTIKVHALKSSARLVGAGELSENARILEEYGKIIRG